MWRKIEKKDIINGAMIRLSIARPYVYAHQNFDSKSGLIGVENFSMTLDRMCGPDTDVQVYQDVANVTFTDEELDFIIKYEPSEVTSSLARELKAMRVKLPSIELIAELKS